MIGPASRPPLSTLLEWPRSRRAPLRGHGEALPAGGRWWTAAVGLAVAGIAAIGCDASEPSTSSNGPYAELPEGAAAQVGSVTIPATAVARVAAEQSVEPRAARERLVHDALLAAGARRGPEAERQDVQGTVRTILAQAVLRQLWQHAQRTAPSPAELGEWARRRWIDVDWPVGYRTVHAVAMVAEDAPASDRARARALAERWLLPAAAAARVARQELAPNREGEARFRFDRRLIVDAAAKEFIAAIRAVDGTGQKAQVERLPVVAADGRVIDYGAPPGAEFVREFTAAAAQLSRRGDLSDVVESPFGYHVILLLERLPARQLPEAERRRVLSTDVWRSRAEHQHRALRRRLRETTAVDVVTNVDALLGLVSVEP